MSGVPNLISFVNLEASKCKARLQNGKTSLLRWVFSMRRHCLFPGLRLNALQRFFMTTAKSQIDEAKNSDFDIRVISRLECELNYDYDDDQCDQIELFLQGPFNKKSSTKVAQI